MNTKTIFLIFSIGLATFVGHAQSERFYAQQVFYVKMKDDLGYSVANKQLQLARMDRKTEDLLRQLSVLGWWSREHVVADEQLQLWRLKANKRLGESLPDFRAEFRFHLADSEKLKEAMRLAQQLADVADVLRIPVPLKLPVPDFSLMQVYKTSQPPGINADSVWMMYNNKGSGIKLCDIEYGFNASHSDLPSVTHLGNAAVDPTGGSAPDHGAAVLGIIVAKDNTWGTTGIAPDCSPYFAAGYTAEDQFNLSAAFEIAMTTLGEGDVLLVEQIVGGPNIDTLTPLSQQGLLPVEWFKPWYNHVKLAVGQGISVVEVAGNGQQNLDDEIYSTGNGGHYPFLAANNSGAIIVGAGGVGLAAGGLEPARARLGFSNYGTRVDLQGNGEAVTTAGYGDLYNTEGVNNYYTKQFGGTSSAASMVAGAVILLQSVYKSETNGTKLSPAEIRDVLKATGKPQTDGTYLAATHRIGPLPDVYRAIKEAVGNITSIKEGNTASSFTIYPNPSSGIFILSFVNTLFADSDIQVYNSAGVVIRNYKATVSAKGPMSVDVSDQPPGIYWLRAVTGAGSVVRKLVLSR